MPSFTGKLRLGYRERKKKEKSCFWQPQNKKMDG